ncbi:MAG: recombinase family protein [Gammaproteobacteria bacterium]
MTLANQDEMGSSVIYCRSAMIEQHKSLVLEQQLTACREFALQRGLKVSHIFEDYGTGPKKGPSMEKMLTLLRQHRDKKLVVITYDRARLGRRMQTSHDVHEAITLAGGSVEFVNAEHELRAPFDSWIEGLKNVSVEA